MIMHKDNSERLIMSQSRFPIYGIMLIFFLGIGVRFVWLASKSGWAHDEAISSICAAGHLGDYHEMVTSKSAPYGIWVQARQWKESWSDVQPFCWDQIRWDLAHNDIHPPLYFWLLNIWSLLAGVHLWSGSLLNLLLDVVTGIILWKLAWDIFKEPQAIVVILCLWF
ncbi:MAG: glycosyltransferase family 39 protein, partial [Planctomycetes bacterium]|nr:glycosyltransferase family 39 protein [Planctomycetota bacterium]